MSTLTFIGSGSTFSLNNFHSNMLLQVNGKRLLIDCGADARHALKRVGLTFRDVSDIYVSHLHSDHAGGLEGFGFNARFIAKTKRPNLFIHPSLVYPLWNHFLKGGMQSSPGSVASLETFFNLPKIYKNKFTWNKIKFEMVRTIHTYNDSKLNPSYGLFFTLNGKRIFITTDTQFVPEVFMPFYKKADLIFHDCETRVGGCGSVHARFEFLATLPLKIKRKMWLYHYDDGPKPAARRAGFLGYVKRGQVFKF
jgi:ribonuclease BN (tRNA processing enzyme)